MLKLIISKLFFMFMSEVNDLGCLKAATAAAELAFKARWELAHKRELRGKYAQAA